MLNVLYGVLGTLVLQFIFLLIIFFSSKSKAMTITTDEDFILQKQINTTEKQKQLNLELQQSIEKLEADLDISHINYNTLDNQYQKAKEEIKTLARTVHTEKNNHQRLISWLKMEEPVVLMKFKAFEELI